MSGPAIFYQKDVTRAIKGAVNAGLNVGRIEIDREGKIVIVAAGEASDKERNDWDD